MLPPRLRNTIAVVALVATGAVALPAAALAQQNGKNETGLPLYPHASTGTQYPAAKDPDGRWYAIYTAESRDSLTVVEGWYRHALPKAQETTSHDALTHGVVLTNGTDKVLIYQLGKRPGAVIELHKYVHS